MYGSVSGPRMGSYHSRMRRDLDVVPRATFATLAPLNPADQQLTDGGEVSTPCEAVSKRGTTVVVPGVLDLLMQGRISGLGMGNFPPQVRRELEYAPRDDSCRGLAP